MTRYCVIFTVQFLNMDLLSIYHFNLSLSSMQDLEGSSQHVKQFQYTGWPSQGVPSSAVGLIDLREQVEKWQRNSGDKPIVIHCRYSTLITITLTTIILTTIIITYSAANRTICLLMVALTAMIACTVWCWWRSTRKHCLPEKNTRLKNAVKCSQSSRIKKRSQWKKNAHTKSVLSIIIVSKAGPLDSASTLDTKFK